MQWLNALKYLTRTNHQSDSMNSAGLPVDFQKASWSLPLAKTNARPNYPNKAGSGLPIWVLKRFLTLNIDEVLHL